jgi:protocatechuate 3,4-dioxygenase beta subunit
MCDHAPKFNGMQRRQLLVALLGTGATMLLAGCSQTGFSPATSTSSDGTDSSDGSGTTGGACVQSATETNGPFPADGSNTAGDGTSTRLDKVYTGSPIIRRDIAESIAGVPLTLNISLQNVRNSCATIPNYYIYIWHCTPTGQYSAYTASNNGGSHSSSESYFRGIQQTDSNGEVTFTTIYPGWYTGRAIHIHAEVYAGLDDASPIKITQFAFPMSINKVVAAQTTYGYKGTSGMMDNTADGIFSDGTSTEMLTVSANSSTGGYTASIAVRVSV